MSTQSLSKSIAALWRRANKPVRYATRSLPLAALLLFSAATLVESAPPPAGTSIGNQASATYTDASNTPRSTTSNVAITIVQQVASFTLTADGSRFAAPGGQVYYPHTVLNTGNGTDTFNLSVANNASGDNFDLASLALYADANGDGLPDNATPIASTGPLASGASFRFVAMGIIPATETAGSVAIITVTASGTATATPAPAQINTDTTTVTANAVVNVTKALSANSGPPGSGPYTVTLTYNNVGNSTATNLTLADLLPAGMSYVPASARWSATGGTTLTDANNADAQGAAPDTITYDFGVTVAGRVTAVIARVMPGQSGTLTFQITIPAATPAGVLQNTASFSYDPGTGTPVGPFNSNTAEFNVIQSVSVTLTGQTIASASQGGTVVFTNIVQNTGNGTDSFDITMANSTFPAGTTFNLFQSDSNTPLVDSTGNGIPDTGPLATNQTYQVIVRVTLPGGTAGGGPYTATKTARSRVNNTVFATANDVLTTITTSTVDVTANAPLPGGAGVGVGPEAAAVVSNTGTPGATTRFTLYVNNTSASADSYSLAASTDSTFAAATLPAGWTVVFRNSANAVITTTGVVPAGGNSLVYADVTLPATATPGATDIYFRGLSPTTTAADVLHAAVVVNAARNLTLAPNNSGTVFPGGAVVYAHLIVNNGNVLEGNGVGSTVNLTVSHSQVGWSSIIYYDADNDGVAGPSDPAVTDLSFVSGGGAGLAPGESVRLLVKVFAPPGVALGTIDALNFTATTVNGSYTTAAAPPTTVTDTTTVISGDVTMIKEQALDANLDGTPDGPFSTAQITTGALPGRSIRYRITVTNVGTAPATSVRVFDTTPAYTTYTTTSPAATTVGTVTAAPANGASGSLEFDLGTLNPGQSAVITFGVIIAQ
jgi:trimeric autotransporter adhesin